MNKEVRRKERNEEDEQVDSDVVKQSKNSTRGLQNYHDESNHASKTTVYPRIQLTNGGEREEGGCRKGQHNVVGV